jgi:hypothetical protein
LGFEGRKDGEEEEKEAIIKLEKPNRIRDEEHRKSQYFITHRNPSLSTNFLFNSLITFLSSPLALAPAFFDFLAVSCLSPRILLLRMDEVEDDVEAPREDEGGRV